MGVADLLKELRLLKGQQGYRYCMAWLVVLTHLLARPSLILATLLLAYHFNNETTFGKALSGLWRIVARAFVTYMQSP